MFFQKELYDILYCYTKIQNYNKYFYLNILKLILSINRGYFLHQIFSSV